MEEDNTAQKMIAWMTRVEINEQTKQQVIAKLDELTKVKDSSIELHHTYYHIRILLRKIAMIQYVTVIEAYEDEGVDPWLPKEGLSIIEKDVTEDMLVLDWLYDTQPDNE